MDEEGRIGQEVLCCYRGGRKERGEGGGKGRLIWKNGTKVDGKSDEDDDDDDDRGGGGEDC